MVTNLRIVPHFFARQAFLTWEFPAEYGAAHFVIQRTEDIVSAPFKTVGSTDEIREFFDPEFHVTRNGRKFHYKVIAQADGKRFDSPAVSWGEQPIRKIYGAGAKAVQQEFISLRASGTRIWVYKRRRLGTVCQECTDPDTGQALSGTLCTNCYGTRIDGGYYQPTLSFAAFQAEDHRHTYDRPEGKRNPRIPTIRTLAYPNLERDDLIFDTDQHVLFTVDSGITFSFANKIPVAQDIQAFRLPHTDVVYYMLSRLTPDGSQ